MIWSLTQSLWTYDGLDAVEMIETQIFRDSLYDHFYSTYTEVDNHASFQTYVPTLLNKLYKRPDPPNPLTGVSATRPILRYRHSSTLEKVCKPKYQNKSFPFEDNAANKDGCIESSSYKTFRPLSNSQNGLVYLSDGVIIRQLRGAVHKGKFTSTDEEIHCGSKKITPEDPNMWTSGAWGLYMKYPSNQGYDLYYSAEDKQKDVLNDWTIKNNSTKCGWIDEKTRAVIFVFTLTFFTDDTNLHQLPNTVVDQSSAFQAYGEYIEVSVKMLFDMPSNGVVRATHQFAVIDKTDITLKWFCFFALVCLNFIKVVYHITDLRFLGITSYFTWIHVLQLASLGLFWISCSAYLWADQRKRFFPLDSARVLTDTTYGEYMCGSLINVEENAQKTSTYLFLTLFSWYSVIEFWMIIHYFRVFPIIMIPLTALSNSALEIAFFFLVFFIVVVGFAFGAHVRKIKKKTFIYFLESTCSTAAIYWTCTNFFILHFFSLDLWSSFHQIVFGEVFEFRSIFHSVITLLLVSVDELDSKEIFESTQHSMYGYIYVYVFRMIAAVVFLNIFIVIVLVQYEIARAEKRYVVDEMHAFMLYWGGKIVSMYGSMRTCCSKKHTKEEYVVRYRKWYHDWREKASGKNQFPPLRHDTEVIMSQLSQIKLTVECLMQNQKKERKQIIISKARIKNSE